MITSEIIIRSGMRPCGECRAYVAATGCVHWKPSQKEHDRKKRNAQCQRRRRARMKEQLEQARQGMAAYRARTGDRE